MKYKTLIFAALVSFVAGVLHAEELEFSVVDGGGDIPLNVVESGSSDGPEILFIHGVSQSYLSWSPQLTAEALQKYRMVAFDLRGHGNSAKPWKAKDYADTKLWADDVAAVIAAKNLKNPLVVAWSYGGIVLMDYIRHYGTEQISGVHLVANAAALIDYIPDPSAGDDAVMQQMIANRARQESSNISDNIASVRFTAPLLTEIDMGDAWRQEASLISMMTPAYVRRALAGRKIDNKDLVGLLRDTPVLLSYGAEDGSVTGPMAEKFRSTLPQTLSSKYEGIGHSPFAEDAQRFNKELIAFATSIGR